MNWTEWNPEPFKDEVEPPSGNVQVKYRNGSSTSRIGYHPANEFGYLWINRGLGFDIVAYRQEVLA